MTVGELAKASRHGRVYAVRCPCGDRPVLTKSAAPTESGFALLCPGCGRWFDGYAGTVRAEEIP